MKTKKLLIIASMSLFIVASAWAKDVIVDGVTVATANPISGIPEPAEVAATIGLLALGFAIYRRKKHK